MAAGTKQGPEPSLSGLFGRARRLAAAYASLLALDARRTFHELLQVMCVAIAATVLLVTAWLALLVAVAGWLIGNGVSWPAILGVAALVNILAAALAGWWIWRRVHEVPFAATLRQLRGDPAPPLATDEATGAVARAGP
jgi:uncharacterized membrane protein YqjE